MPDQTAREGVNIVVGAIGQTDRVLVVFPPITEARLFPYLSLPMIAAYLRERGVPVQQVDLNLELTYALFVPEYLERHSATRGEDNSLNHSYRALVARYLLKEHASIIREAMSRESSEQTSRAIRLLQRGVDMVLEASPLSQTLRNFDELESRLESTAAAADDAGMNVLHELVIEALGSPPPRIVAISVAFFSQIFPSFAIAAWVKRHSPSTTVVLGGQQIMLWGTELAKLSAFGDSVDFLGVGKGETTLFYLARFLDGLQSLESVPDLITPAGRTASARNLGIQLQLENCPVPDFSDLPLHKYLAGEMQLPLITCIGCYWGKCVFCSYGNRSLYDRSYEQATPEWIANACRSLVQQYGTARINFVDENVNLHLLMSALRLLASTDVRFEFSTRNRLEPSLLDRRVCEELKRFGCVLMSCGYETNSQRLLNMMDKGLNADSFQRIVDNLDAVGIPLRLSVMGGVFDETASETKSSHDFLKRNEAKLGIDTFQMLVMEPQTILSNAASRFGLTPSSSAALRGNELLNYGAGRMGREFSYPAPETFQSHLERLVELHDTIRPGRNDEWPTQPEFGAHFSSSASTVRLHPWIGVLPDPDVSAHAECVILADIVWQRFFRVRAEHVRLSQEKGSVTLTMPVSKTSQAWRDALELGLGVPDIRRQNS